MLKLYKLIIKYINNLKYAENVKLKKYLINNKFSL